MLHRWILPAALTMAALSPLSVTAQSPVSKPSAQSSAAALRVNVAKPVTQVSPKLYGLMTEEINFSYDGGLYAELINNRHMWDYGWEPSRWFVVQNHAADAAILMDKVGPSADVPTSLKLSAKTASADDPAGVLNQGYWGIPVRPNTLYKGSFFAKSSNVDKVTVSLVSDDTGKAVASAVVTGVGSEWKAFAYEFKSSAVAPSTANHLVLSIEKPGDVWLSLVSLFPPTYKNREHGFRSDLMEKMAGMHPTFLRMPGGNYLEGNHINERFDWKKTIGPWTARPTHMSPWGYRSTDGLGLQEFLYWCEDLKIEPVLAVYAGYSLNQEHVEPGKELESYVQDALDEIEYVIGPADSKWGSLRAKAGHPEPYKLTYVEIGNEDNFDKSNTYEGRYAQFYKAIKEKYPQLQLIATMPLTKMTPDVVDDHYYRRQDEFFNDTHHYDKADRKGPKIFVGEWATMEGVPTPALGQALSDAAWMTGMERNSDLIVMAAYAPLLVNVNPGGMQWKTNLIGYDALNSFASPSYYAQAMFMSHMGDVIVDSSVSGAGARFYYSAMKDTAKGKLYLKLVNASTVAQKIDVSLEGAEPATLVKVETLSGGSREATNTLARPKNVAPVSTSYAVSGAKFTHTAPPLSVQVLTIDLKAAKK